MARILTLTLNPALDLTLRLPRLEPGAVNRGQALVSHAAGKGLNVAQVLADLGHSLSVSGFLGAGNAQPFEALFARRGFHDAFVRVEGETRSNLKLAEDDGRITDINGPGPDVDAAARDELLRRLDALVPGHDLVVVAGSLPRGVDANWFTTLLQRLHGLGARVALDSSGAALRAGLASAPWLVKPNAEELADACGRPLDELAEQAEEAARLQAAGIEHLVLSMGAEGVRWFSRGQALQSSPPKVKVASTVGAGDSLLAGMVHGLLAGWPAERTLAHATAIAAQAVTQIGFGINDRAQLAALESAVRVQPVEEQNEVPR